MHFKHLGSGIFVYALQALREGRALRENGLSSLVVSAFQFKGRGFEPGRGDQFGD